MKKSIPKIREQEGNEKIHSHNSGMGIWGFHSWEWTGTGIPAHPCDGDVDGDYRCDSQRSGHVGLERWKFLQLQSWLGEQPPNNKHRPGEQEFNLSRITSFLQ